MPDRMAWSDLIPEVVLWPFLRRIGGKFDIREKYQQNRVLAKISLVYRFSGMPDRMAWSDLIPEVVLWPFLCMRTKSIVQSAPKSVFLATIAWLYRFSGMPDRMAWSDLISEVVFWPFLRMRSKNMAQNPIQLRFEPKFWGYIGLRPCQIEWRG
jgi:hypothetical protein